MALLDKTGILEGSLIRPEHITRIYETLDGTGLHEINATGSLSGSFRGAINATGSFSGSFSGVIVGSVTAGTASFATSASAVSITNTTTGTGPYYVTFVDATSGFDNIRTDSTGLAYNADTNTLTVTASRSISSSYALTASYVTSAASFPFTGNAQITGSLGVTGGITGSLRGTASVAISASAVEITDVTSGGGTLYLTFVDGTSGHENLKVDSSTLTYNATANRINSDCVGADEAQSIWTYNATTGTGPYYLTFVDDLTNSVGKSVYTDSTGLTYNATTNILTTTASRAISSSYAVTASHALTTNATNAISSSYADVANSVDSVAGWTQVETGSGFALSTNTWRTIWAGNLPSNSVNVAALAFIAKVQLAAATTVGSITTATSQFIDYRAVVASTYDTIGPSVGLTTITFSSSSLPTNPSSLTGQCRLTSGGGTTVLFQVQHQYAGDIQIVAAIEYKISGAGGGA